FAGLRCGEICRLRREDVYLDAACPTADVVGKGGKLRTVPLVAPVVTELRATGLARTGWLITRGGEQYPSAQLSIDSHHHLRSLGIATTLHSMRHAFATTTYQSTRDLLLLKDLLGHESVATTQIYAQPDMDAVHDRLAGVADTASSLLGPRRLRAVR
ncbi:MAG: site-specific integrase, partial [Mycobacterium sp.]|nr:site-specific integrase [Mycobacterium sp.]